MSTRGNQKLVFLVDYCTSIILPLVRLNSDPAPVTLAGRRSTIPVVQQLQFQPFRRLASSRSELRRRRRTPGQLKSRFEEVTSSSRDPHTVQYSTRGTACWYQYTTYVMGALSASATSPRSGADVLDRGADSGRADLTRTHHRTRGAWIKSSLDTHCQCRSRMAAVAEVEVATDLLSSIAPRADPNNSVDPMDGVDFQQRMAEALAEFGGEAFPLSGGDPDLPTPQHICDAANAAIAKGEHHYTDKAGIVELRAAISAHIKKTDGLDYSASEIVVTTSPVRAHGVFPLSGSGRR